MKMNKRLDGLREALEGVVRDASRLRFSPEVLKRIAPEWDETFGKGASKSVRITSASVKGPINDHKQPN